MWERLEKRYGVPELIKSSLRRKISSFTKIGNHGLKRLYNLVDLVEEIASVKPQSQYALLFRHFDSPHGINSIIAKLPTFLQDKWTVETTKYKKRESAVYPPFTFFIDYFLNDITRMKNNPSFNYSCSNGEKPFVNHPRNLHDTVVAARTTETLSSPNNISIENTELHRCPLHNSNHSLNE